MKLRHECDVSQLCTDPFTHLYKNETVDWPLLLKEEILFFKWLLSLKGLTTHLYFLYIYKAFYIFLLLLFISCIFKLPFLLAFFFSLWLFLNKLLWILPLFGKIAYLWERTCTFKKHHPWRKFIFWQLVRKNSEFCLFSLLAFFFSLIVSQ